MTHRLTPIAFVLGFLVLALALVLVACERSPEARYQQCLREGHGRAACEPLLRRGPRVPVAPTVQAPPDRAR